MTRRSYIIQPEMPARKPLSRDMAAVRTMVVVVIGCLLAWIIAFAIGIRVANAHSFYSWSCCSDRDCAPMPKPLWPQPMASGWLLYDGTVWPYVDTKIAPDSQFHECKRPDGKRLCLYAPTAGI